MSTGCAVCGWGRAYFLPSTWCGPIVQICAGNIAGSIGIFSLLLSLRRVCSSHHQRAGWGCTRSWEGTQLMLAEQRDIADHMMPSSAYKAEGGGRKELCLPAQVITTRDVALLSWRQLSICLLMGSEGIPCCALLAPLPFAVPVFSSTHEFSHFDSSRFSLHPSSGQRASSWVGLNHNKGLQGDNAV